MSIASELNRLLQAKSDLATSIAAKGVAVPAATTIDGYAALVDQIQQGGGILPYDAKVEYIENSETQYIDTGIKASNTVYLKIWAQDFFNSSHLGKWLFGARNGSNNKTFGLFINANSGKVTLSYNNNTVVYDTYSSYPSSCWIELGGGTLRIGSTTHTYTQATFTSNYNIYLFLMNNAGSIAGQSTARIGQAFITSGTKLLFLTPVRKGQIGYMYNELEDALHPTSGSGNFVAGPDVT